MSLRLYNINHTRQAPASYDHNVGVLSQIHNTLWRAGGGGATISVQGERRDLVGGGGVASLEGEAGPRWRARRPGGQW